MLSVLRRVARRGCKNSRNFSAVTVLGSCGGIGQPLSMLLKNDVNVSDLRLYDVMNTAGVAADLSHVCTPAKVTGHTGPDEIAQALKGTQVVVCPAGVPRKPGMSRDDLFDINAGIVKSLATSVAVHCPGAMVCIISNPVNSMVPLFAEILKAHGVYDPKRLFGVTTLDVVRARTFVAQDQGFDVLQTSVPVIGGHAGITILPLLSQVEGAEFSDKRADELTHRIQFGGDEVVKAKAGAGSATLSMAYAGWLFSSKLIQAMNGAKVTECTFVQNNLTDSPFFSTPVTLGPNGAEQVHPFGTLSADENKRLHEMLPDLVKQVQKGVEFANK